MSSCWSFFLNHGIWLSWRVQIQYDIKLFWSCLTLIIFAFWLVGGRVYIWSWDFLKEYFTIIFQIFRSCLRSLFYICGLVSYISILDIYYIQGPTVNETEVLREDFNTHLDLDKGTPTPMHCCNVISLSLSSPKTSPFFAFSSVEK